MDNSTADQRLEHHQDPPKYISLRDLYKLTGIEYFKVSICNFYYFFHFLKSFTLYIIISRNSLLQIEGLDSLKDNELLNKLKKDRNYSYEDELVCSKECLPNYEEKVHHFFSIFFCSFFVCLKTCIVIAEKLFPRTFTY